MMKMIKCGCTSYLGNPNGAKFQNETYGEGNRVATVSADEKTYKCTVCEKEHAGKSEFKESKGNKKK